MTEKIDISMFVHEKKRAAIMGIVNVTPDSFSDGNDGEKSIDKALRLIDEGADIIDIGGESTRPGAVEVSEAEEKERVLGLLVPLKKIRPDVCVSVDTRKSRCAKVFLDNGADIINDVSGLVYSPDMAQVAAKYNAKLIIMHSLSAGIADAAYSYNDVVSEVCSFLQKQKEFAISCGVAKSNIIIDPGLGFSKNTDENFELIKNIKRLSDIAPVLIGHSRKRFIRDFLGIENVKDSDGATACLSVFAAASGCAIIRVHNVKQTVGFLHLADRLRSS